MSGARHEITAGGQEHEDAPAVYAPDLLGGSDTVHVNVHEYGGKTAFPKCLQESLSVQEGNGFYPAAVLCGKMADKFCHFVQILLFIVNESNSQIGSSSILRKTNIIIPLKRVFFKSVTGKSD